MKRMKEIKPEHITHCHLLHNCYIKCLGILTRKLLSAPPFNDIYCNLFTVNIIFGNEYKLKNHFTFHTRYDLTY